MRLHRPAITGIVLLLALLPIPSAPAVEQGLPFISWYAPADYRAGSQNWAITQGDDGVVYFGNDGTIVAFDGVRWQQIGIVQGLAVRSLNRSADGRILVGSQGEFGYLERQADGSMLYRSLLPKLPDHAPEFTDVWQVLVDGDNWYFSTTQALFHYSQSGFRVHHHADQGGGGSFLVNGQLYTDITGVGLNRLTPEGFRPLAVADPELSIYAMLPMTDHRLLMGSRQQGLYVLDPVADDIEPVAPETSRVLSELHIYHGTILPDGRYAFATLRGGIVLVDLDQDRYEVLDRSRGLPDPRVRELYVDADGGLWIALDSGIARLEPQSIISQWDQRTGLDGPVLSLKRHQGRLYAGTTMGLYLLVDGRFETVSGINSEVWDLLAWRQPDDREILLAATSFGIHRIDNDQARLISDTYLSMSMAVTRDNPWRLWVATYDRGLGYIDWQEDEDEAQTVFTDIMAPGRRLEVDHENQLWLETWLDGIFRIDPVSAGLSWQHPPPDSTADRTGLTVLINQHHQLIAAREQIWQWHEDGSLIERDDLRPALLEPGTGSVRLVADRPDQVWSISTDGLVNRIRIGQMDAPWETHPIDILLGRLPDLEFYAIHFDTDETVWIGGSQALYQVDMNHQPHQTGLLRIGWRQIRAGTRLLPLPPQNAPEILDPETDFPLRFQVAATAFDWPEGTRYRYLLEPTRREWSDWQSAAETEFNHLPPGQYKLIFQARDAYGQLDTTVPFEFTIPSPWYLNASAVLIGAAGLILMIPVLLWLGGRRHSRRNRQLERMVTDRTRELQQQKILLQKERDRLDYLSQHDDLTGLPNRRQGNQRLLSVWETIDPSQRPVSLALTDIDHFKRVNDQLGHDTGDRVLIEVANLLKSSLRPEDLVVRWGGEEFLLLFPNTSLADAAAVCHRIHDLVCDHDWAAITIDQPVTLSTGLTASSGGHSVTEVLARADELLYRAKQQGRNRVEVERENW
jgi:diguanylate cyclase (GGDEF)-like protein